MSPRVPGRQGIKTASVPEKFVWAFLFCGLNFGDRKGKRRKVIRLAGGRDQLARPVPQCWRDTVCDTCCRRR